MMSVRWRPMTCLLVLLAMLVIAIVLVLVWADFDAAQEERRNRELFPFSEMAPVILVRPIRETEAAGRWRGTSMTAPPTPPPSAPQARGAICPSPPERRLSEMGRWRGSRSS